MKTNGLSNMKRIVSVMIVLATIMAMIPIYSMNVYAEEAHENSVTTRDDGIWLFPVDKKYYGMFSDWAGCQGTKTCPFDQSDKYDCKQPKEICTAHNNSKNGGHNGIDIAVSQGTSVYAAAPGTIVYIHDTGSTIGNVIIIKHEIDKDHSYYSYYYHLLNFAENLKEGMTVQAGDIIAKSGYSIYYKNGVEKHSKHLHFGIVYGDSKEHNNYLSYIQSLQKQGWLTDYTKQSGRIVTNPKDGYNPSGTKYSKGVVVEYVDKHRGSVTYTFDKTEVTVGYKCKHQQLQCVSAKSPTCTTEGNYKYYKCSSCDGYVLDSNKNVTTLEKVTKPKLAHSFYSNVKTISGNSVFCYTCSNCNGSFCKLTNDKYIREDAGTNYAKIIDSKIPAGSLFQIASTKMNGEQIWAYGSVEYKGKTYSDVYVCIRDSSGWQIEALDPNEKSTILDESILNLDGNTYTFELTNAKYCRKGAGVSYAKLDNTGMIPSGTRFNVDKLKFVEVNNYKEVWGHGTTVSSTSSYNGKTGWICLDDCSELQAKYSPSLDDVVKLSCSNKNRVQEKIIEYFEYNVFSENITSINTLLDLSSKKNTFELTKAKYCRTGAGVQYGKLADLGKLPIGTRLEVTELKLVNIDENTTEIWARGTTISNTQKYNRKSGWVCIYDSTGNQATYCEKQDWRSGKIAYPDIRYSNSYTYYFDVMDCIFDIYYNVK